jgi:hypothetical protein
MPWGMESTAEQFARIEAFLPHQRGNVSHENLAVINAILIFPPKSGEVHPLCRRERL